MSRRLESAAVIAVYAAVLLLLLRPNSAGQHLVTAAGTAFAELAI